MSTSKSKSKNESNIAEIVLAGGPRDGDRLQLATPLRPSLRLAFPEWAIYRLNADGTGYTHDPNVDPRPSNAIESEAHRARTEAAWTQAASKAEVARVEQPDPELVF